MLILILMAFAASTLGAISGLGGGVFIIPILVSIMGREWSPASLAALSLSVVILNSLTTLFLGRQIKNADIGFAKAMILVSGVGAIVGVYLQSLISRESFEISLSVLLLALSFFIFWRSGQADADLPEKPEPFHGGDSAFGFVIGLVASFFGLGGGVLQVPYMVIVRKFAVKQATGTSQIILSSVSAISLILYLGVRQVPVPWETFLYLAPVVVTGGIVGSKLAKRMRGPWIIRLLGAALFFLAIRVGLKAFEIQG